MSNLQPLTPSPMHFRLVVIGTSLGGLCALQSLLPGLPQGFPLPVVIVQHRHRDSDESLAHLLQASCSLPLAEAEDKAPLVAGHVYLAPANYHLLIESDSFALSTEAPFLHARPSIDVLFFSAADAYGAHVIGVLLTGASEDGAAGLARIEARGGVALVQEPSSAECAVMPQAGLRQCRRARTLPLARIAPALVQFSAHLPR